MEDDDEFGDLYTDVLRPLSAAPQLQQTFSPAPSSLQRPVDLNLKSNDQVSSYPAYVPDSTLPRAVMLESHFHVLDAPSRADKGGEFTDNNDVKVKFDIEEGANGISNDDDGAGIEIPGISQNDVVIKEEGKNEGQKPNDVGEGEEDDWESDSEDDLQIVLNEENHRPMLIEEGGGDDDDDDEDEDGNPLVIVADEDASKHQGLMVDEQEWGGDDVATQMGDGGAEKKDGTVEQANVAASAVAATAKIGYRNHFAYHNPYHSQFKYVRPGAALIPGPATVGAGGATGQVRPLVNMGFTAGHGRGDWRPIAIKTAPPLQKGFHPSFGMSASGGNMAGRGLEFTLPSHKAIFEVDIDGFEEKPWKYPGVDLSDFFNFGLNEDSWKDYCKQLEQLRLETTMQSKIRVYESGREQEYDPELPPELAAATGILDVPPDNANLGKSDVRQSDLTKGPARVRPPVPTGRAIQVEGGFGERLPSIDTRPPRIRDSDAIIEIVCQDSVDDDSSTDNGDPDNDPLREDFREESHGAEDEMGPIDTESFGGFPEAFNGQNRELVRRGAPYMNVVCDNIPEGNGSLPLPPEALAQHRSVSRGPTPKYPHEYNGTSNEKRRKLGRKSDRSSPITPSRSPQIKKFNDNQDDECAESMEGKLCPLSSPATARDEWEFNVEHKDAVLHELVTGDESYAIEKEETNTGTTSDNCKDGIALQSLKKQKINSQVEQTELQEFDEEDSRAARSSENSKARSGSSRDHKKWHDGVEEEVIQDSRSTHLGSMKKHLEDNGPIFGRKDPERRQEMGRNQMVAKGREGFYPHRDFDPSLSHDMHMKFEGFERRKERDHSDGVWQRREDELYSRKNRTKDTRKREREHLDEIEPRHRNKDRESERTDRDEHLHSKKQLESGSYRLHYDKDAGSRLRERDDGLKSRYEMVDDHISKRRKDDGYIRWDHAESDEILHGHKDSTSRRNRERDDILDQQRRKDEHRIRENIDDHHPVRHKDEGWLQRERGERQREKEEWPRLKPHEEILLKREREEGRGAVRSVRSSEDRAWVGYARVKDEYKGSDKEYLLKDTVRHSEQLKRRERIEDESLPHRGRKDVYARGNQFSNEEKRSRHERSAPRNERAASTSDNIRMHNKKHKESSRKNRDSDVGDHSSSVASKKNQEDQSSHVSEMGVKGTLEQGNGVNAKPVPRNSSRKRKEEASSDDERQDSRRGRSKLERWTSHKERDLSIDIKSSASVAFKEIIKNNSGGTLETTKLPEEPTITVENVDNKQRPLADKKDSGNHEIEGTETKPADDQNLDTVEKLKKRSERFKLPMPIEKDTLAIKKMESEPQPSAKSESPADSEIKQERPARRRRWISS